MEPLPSVGTLNEEELSVEATPSLVVGKGLSGLFSISFRFCSVTPPLLMLFFIGLGGAFDIDSSVDIFSASKETRLFSCWVGETFLVGFWGALSFWGALLSVDTGLDFLVKVDGLGGGEGLFSRLFAEPDDLVRTMEAVEIKSGERLEKLFSVGALFASTVVCCPVGVCEGVCASEGNGECCLKELRIGLEGLLSTGSCSEIGGYCLFNIDRAGVLCREGARLCMNIYTIYD